MINCYLLINKEIQTIRKEMVQTTFRQSFSLPVLECTITIYISGEKNNELEHKNETC